MHGSARYLMILLLFLSKMQNISGGVSVMAVLHLWKSASNPAYRGVCPALPRKHRHERRLLPRVKAMCCYLRNIATNEAHKFASPAFTASGKQVVPERSLIEYLIAEADKLEKDGNVEAAYLYLKKHIDEDKSELLWRFGRACSQMYQFSNVDRKQLEIVVQEGLIAAKRASELDEQNPHCFYVSCMQQLP